MKIKILCGFVAVCLTFAAAADGRTSPKNDLNEEMDWNDKLDLTEAQKVQLKLILEESRAQTADLQKQIEELNDKIINIKKGDEEKIRAILTEKQQVKFDKIKMRQQRNDPENEKLWKGKNKPSRKRMRQL